MEKNRKISLSDGEWKLMNFLWGQNPCTITELTRLLKEETGWSKNTVITMLNRLEAKGAVVRREGERARQYVPAIGKDEAALAETAGLLNRVYKGSLSLLVNTMVSSRTLSKEDIEELYGILKKAEEDAHD